MTDTLTFKRDRETLDALLWRTYRREVAGLVEATLALNPGLADLGPYPPIGTVIQVDAPSAASSTPTIPLVRLY